MTLWVPKAIATPTATASNPAFSSALIQPYDGSLREHLAELWLLHQGFIFGLALGAVVRLIAPLLQSKVHDPAVIVVDETAQHVISVCSGHQGRADDLTRWVAIQLGATPILTGAANSANRVGIDVLGRPFGWQRGGGDWTGVSAAIARQETVQVIQDAGSTLWQQHLPENHGLSIVDAKSDVDLDSESSDTETDRPAHAVMWISHRQCHGDARKFVQWHPRVLWIGIGCERNTPRIVVETAIQQACQQHQLAEKAIAGIATLDLKVDEPGLVELCRDRHWPLHCFTADQLNPITVPTPSSVVEKAVGTASVAEAAALLAATHITAPTPQPPNSPTPQLPNPPTPQLLLPKQVHRLPPHPGAVTVAIAQSPQEYIGKSGQLYLVGMGPGALDQMTPAAKGAIVQADAVIGYSLYLDLSRPLFRPGQIVESLPITQERQRAERAIALAQWGLSVAVVSSGDCGIYGMAGLVMEQLQQAGWDGHSPEVQVFPGVTALQAAAARVGAPLMHDFCAISLSDLLTPWAVIERRLEAAAQADFVTALYNPKSKTRTEQIAIAQQIFLRHREPTTPVALIRSAYREDEQIRITTLKTLLEAPIDMMTLVLIGNCSTRQLERWLITPRGYLPTSD